LATEDKWSSLLKPVENSTSSQALLFVMAGRNRRGIAMVKADIMREVAEKIMHGLEVAEKERPETTPLRKPDV
jgi:hypothetical protein